MFVYIWEYDVREPHRAAFERAYGPAGDWAELFSQDAGYIRTELLHDVQRAGRYITIDYWESRGSRDAFRRKFAEAFAALDVRCEGLTERETFIGDFETLPLENHAEPYSE